MSEAKGPYTVVQIDSKYCEVRDQSDTYVDGFSSRVDAHCLADQLNLAHHHALAAQAERVKELHVAWDRARQIVRDLAYASNSGEDAHCAFCMAFEDTGAHTAGCKMAEAIAEMERIDAALTPPAKGTT